jgi:hypothetical protein
MGYYAKGYHVIHRHRNYSASSGATVTVTLMNNYQAELTPEEVVATFPEGKKVVKRLLKENEAFLVKVKEAENDVRQTLGANGVSMFDLDFATKLVMTMVTPAEEQAIKNIHRLTRLLYLYEPPKKSETGVTDMDIANAKEYPINHLLEVKHHKTKCLWHDDRNPSMHVYKDHVYCFVCNKHADAIDIYMKIHNSDFITAVKALI